MARKGSPFLSSISYGKKHPTTSPFPDPDPHSPPSPRAFIVTICLLFYPTDDFEVFQSAKEVATCRV